MREIFPGFFFFFYGVGGGAGVGVGGVYAKC